MAIPASHIVSINPRVISGGSSDLELNGLLFSKSRLISASTLVLEFPGEAAVGAYFGEGSPEHLAAQVYFTSYNNKFSAPKSFFVARRLDEAAPAWLRGAKNVKTLEQFKAISDGALVISIDNTSHTVSGVDFSQVASFSDAAAALAAKLPQNAAKVEYSSLSGAFTVTSATSGANSAVGYAAAPSAGTDLAAFFGLRQEDGAVLSEGCEALNVQEQMRRVRARTENWVSFSTAWEEGDEAMLEWAAWANANYGWLYVPYTTSPAAISADSQSDPASLIKNAGYDHTAVVYGSLEYAAFIMGVVASVAWQRANGAVTAAFKRQSGLAARVADQREAQILESKNCNYFGNFATRNAEFLFLYPGCLSASDYGFIDAYVNSVWLNNRLQVALMDGITSAGRVPYTERGYTMIRAWMMDPISEARNNGVIEPGVELSERQKSELMNEAGLDISGELKTQGYYRQVLDPGAAVRAERGSPVVSLWYTYGGAVQKIDVASTAVL